MSDPFATLRELQRERQRVDPRQFWQEGIADALDPAKEKPQTPYSHYQNDPVGFCRDVLGIDNLTPDQVKMLEAIRDHEAVIVMSATGVGKTYILAAAAIWLYKCWEQIEVYTAAAPPERNLKQLLWGELGVFTRKKPKVFEGDKINNLLITRAPKQKIEGVRIPAQGKDEDLESAFSGKHQANLAFIFDEGDAIPDPVYRGAEGCMSGGNGRLIICYNPKKKEGKPYEMITDKTAFVVTMSAFDHPNVISGLDLIPGAVTRAVTVRRINEWTEEVHEDEEIDDKCFLLPDFLIGEVGFSASGQPYPPLAAGYRRITNPEFAYKVLGQYPPIGADQLIQEAWLEAAVSRWVALRALNNGEIIPPGGIRPIMGFDVAGGGPDRQSVTFRYGGWIPPPISHQEMDTDMAAQWAARLYKEKEAKICYVDATGVGAAAAPRMIRMSEQLQYDINAVPIYQNAESQGGEGGENFYSLRDEAYWRLREDFRTGTAVIPPADFNESCRRFHKALRKLTYEKRGSDIKIVEKKVLIKRLGYSPDELESFMLTYCPGMAWFGGI